MYVPVMLDGRVMDVAFLIAPEVLTVSTEASVTVQPTRPSARDVPVGGWDRLVRIHVPMGYRRRWIAGCVNVILDGSVLVATASVPITGKSSILFADAMRNGEERRVSVRDARVLMWIVPDMVHAIVVRVNVSVIMVGPEKVVIYRTVRVILTVIHEVRTNINLIYCWTNFQSSMALLRPENMELVFYRTVSE